MDTFRIPTDADRLRVDVYDTATTKLIVTQSFNLPVPGSFPFSVTLVESGAAHPEIKIFATALLGTSQVGIGDVTVGFRDGTTFNAQIVVNHTH